MFLLKEQLGLNISLLTFGFNHSYVCSMAYTIQTLQLVTDFHQQLKKKVRPLHAATRAWPPQRQWVPLIAVAALPDKREQGASHGGEPG